MSGAENDLNNDNNIMEDDHNMKVEMVSVVPPQNLTTTTAIAFPTRPIMNMSVILLHGPFVLANTNEAVGLIMLETGENLDIILQTVLFLLI